MASYPKPTKAARKAEAVDNKDKLLKYRRQQYMIALDRDDGHCVFCYFKHGKETQAVDMHHVYSRSNKNGSELWREGYQYLLSTCRECHPQPIKDDKPGPKLQWVEDIRVKANENPINPRFKPPKTDE